MSDAITRKLDFMRADIEEPGSTPAARLIAGHAALLLAAVEAVLKAADDFDFEASRQERGAGLSAASGGMIIPAGQRGRAETHRDCARTLREAIRAALSGKEASDEH